MAIYLKNEFDSSWPLWASQGRGIQTALQDDRLSELLATRIRAWAAFFHEHYSWELGWDHPRNERSHRIEGQCLVLLLREALGTEIHVELRLWECESTKMT